MKPDEDDCWQQGGDAFCAENFPDYPYCSKDYNRCVECMWNEDCPSYQRYCTWDKRCVECEVDAQCQGDNEFCIDDVCREKTCVDLANEGFPDYCRDRHPATPICDYDRAICVECLISPDCADDEVCINDVCVPITERDCMDLQGEGVYDYCEKFYPSRPICHTQLRECVECQFDVHCDGDKECINTRCISDEIECEMDEDCISDRWKCVQQECVLKICTDYDDPDAFCDSIYAGWRCREDGVCVKCIEDVDCQEDQICDNYKCVKKTCDKYKNPDKHCQSVFGDSYRCIGTECIDMSTDKCSDFLSTAEADEYCEDKNSAKPHCDFSTGECEECVLEQDCPAFWICWNHECRECLNHEDCDRDYKCTYDPNWSCVPRTCSEIEYCAPDEWCRRKYGEGYVCENDECVLGCGGIDDRCPKGYYCPQNECVWGCRGDDNCPDLKPHCSLETGECEECYGDIHCGIGYECISYICVKSADCHHDDKLCQENEYCDIDTCVPGCRDSENCSMQTPHCSQNTGMCEECVYDVHCDAGYDCDNYNCVWVGYDCEIDPNCPKNWMCHDQRKECVFGCSDSINCSEKTPHCSQATGECEECWSTEHCEWWQECDNYVCVARPGYEECVEGDVRPGYRCRDGVWVRMECNGPEDCLGHEDCIDGLCLDKERECESPNDCAGGYYCDFTTYRCAKQICVSHEDCAPGKCCGLVSLEEMRNGCEPCEEYPCKAWGPCPAGWLCSQDTGYCIEADCMEDSDCGDPHYKCENWICIAKTCEDADDPLDWCRKEKGWYYRCMDDECILLNCTSYEDPDMMCMDIYGESYRCEEGRCKDAGPGGTENPDMYCVEKMGIDEAFWNYDKEECDIPNCDTVQDPDKLCAQLKDERYKCRDGECRRGREGEECENPDECMPTLSCKEGICIKYECYGPNDCDPEREWCNNHICVPLDGTCDGDEDCDDAYHCGPNHFCVPDGCTSHDECSAGYCCNEFGDCVRCGEMTCFGNYDCRDGWRCNESTNKCEQVECRRSSDCESGYYCDLNDGVCREVYVAEPEKACWGDWDCPANQECIGQYIRWPAEQFPFGLEWGQGICSDSDLIMIEGPDDDKTCDYCREMRKKVGKVGDFPLPPYHEHCRCSKFIIG